MSQFSFLIKPASSLCNLRCRYCFYADEARNREKASTGLMGEETAALLLREAYGAVGPRGFVTFAFQGGEPTLAGLDFFRRFTARARETKPPGVGISFSIQTNGTMLNEEWARFFQKEDYLVGVSLDGFPDLHNLYRLDAEGNDTWNRAAKNAALLKKTGVRVNALCVVTAQCARSAQKAYQSLKKAGFDYLQFIACLDPMGEERGGRPWSLTPEAYGQFLCELFDLWYRDWERGEYRSVRLFDDYVHLLLNDGGSTCATCGQCGGYLVVEADGTVYPCDFFALDQWRLGTLGEQSLSDMLESDAYRRFMDLGAEKPGECNPCPGRMLCNGGCKNDWVRAADENHNYFCSAFRRLFDHAGERLLRIARAEYAQRTRMGR